MMFCQGDQGSSSPLPSSYKPLSAHLNSNASSSADTCNHRQRRSTLAAFPMGRRVRHVTVWSLLACAKSAKHEILSKSHSGWCLKMCQALRRFSPTLCFVFGPGHPGPNVRLLDTSGARGAWQVRVRSCELITRCSVVICRDVVPCLMSCLAGP